MKIKQCTEYQTAGTKLNYMNLEKNRQYFIGHGKNAITPQKKAVFHWPWKSKSEGQKSITPFVFLSMKKGLTLDLSLWKSSGDQGTFETYVCSKWYHQWRTTALFLKWQNILKVLTANAFSDSLCIQIIPWSDVALHDSTICSNLPSTGMAVLTSGGNLPHLSSNKCD